MENKINELIIVKQLPVIEQMLDEMSKEIDAKIETALRLIPEDPDRILAETKKIRAELNKELAELETARKKVKTEVMQPYLEFEEIYKTKISDKYKKADKVFKSKIEECENAIKEKRAEGFIEFFNEYCKANGITERLGEIVFEDMPLKVGVSGSDRSYREKIKDWLDGIKSDLEVIENSRDEKTKLELLVEYKKDFNLRRAILEYEQRERSINEVKGGAQKTEPAEQEITAPAVQETGEVFEMTFTVHGTKTQLKALKEYLVQNNLI
jgi:hypothetical protein